MGDKGGGGEEDNFGEQLEDNPQLVRTKMGLFGGKSMVRSVRNGGPEAQPGEGKGKKGKDWRKQAAGTG